MAEDFNQNRHWHDAMSNLNWISSRPVWSGGMVTQSQAAVVLRRLEHLTKYASCHWTCDSRILDEDDATKRKGLPCSCGFAPSGRDQP